MFAYKEFLVNAYCPYCEREFSTIIGQLQNSFMHRCSDCSRGLTILPLPTMQAFVEVGTSKQLIVDIISLNRECCGNV